MGPLLGVASVASFPDLGDLIDLLLDLPDLGDDPLHLERAHLPVCSVQPLHRILWNPDAADLPLRVRKPATQGFPLESYHAPFAPVYTLMRYLPVS